MIGNMENKIDKAVLLSWRPPAKIFVQHKLRYKMIVLLLMMMVIYNGNATNSRGYCHKGCRRLGGVIAYLYFKGSSVIYNSITLTTTPQPSMYSCHT